jgi:hypothetical protein
VEDIRYSKKIESSKIGFNAPAEAWHFKKYSERNIFKRVQASSYTL